MLTEDQPSRVPDWLWWMALLGYLLVYPIIWLGQRLGVVTDR